MKEEELKKIVDKLKARSAETEWLEFKVNYYTPQEKYRNPFLINAMINLNMIEKIGGGIKKMFQIQQKRFFPMPSYDLAVPERVVVKIAGKILDENYTRLLIENTEMELLTVMLLDKVQKNVKISREGHKFLKSKKLTEGRYPHLFVSHRIASVVDERAKYIKNRGFDKRYYQDLMTTYLKKYGHASRKDFNSLLVDKLPDVLNEKRKLIKIKNLIYEMSKKSGKIYNKGSDRKPMWILAENGDNN